jgi:hypothetical protein
MKWILVYITLSFHGHPIATEEGRFNSMTDCFFARESLAESVGGVDGHFPKGQQAVCIPHPDPELQ